MLQYRQKDFHVNVTYIRKRRAYIREIRSGTCEQKRNFFSFSSDLYIHTMYTAQLQPEIWNNKTAKANSPQNIFDISRNKKF